MKVVKRFQILNMFENYADVYGIVTRVR